MIAAIVANIYAVAVSTSVVMVFIAILSMIFSALCAYAIYKKDTHLPYLYALGNTLIGVFIYIYHPAISDVMSVLEFASFNIFGSIVAAFILYKTRPTTIKLLGMTYAK
jgi:uncharacterized membrane protein YjfL (UPF0719 family)